MVKIAVLASFNMDLVMRAERRPGAGETLQGAFSMHLGGKGFNQAVAARRLGAEVVVVGRVGNDAFGRQFLAALDGEGIDRRAVVVDADEGTGVASIVVEPDGGNSILQAPQANRHLTSDDIAHAGEAMRCADMAMLQLETAMAPASAFAQAMRESGATMMLNPAPAMPVPAELLALCDIIVPNEIEARALTAGRHAASATAIEMAHDLVGLGPTRAVITLGDEGAVALADGRVHRTPPFQVQVVDTVGAGDAFCAALAVRLAEGAPIEVALRYASAAGALACTAIGAEPSMPRRADVEALLVRGEGR